MYVALAVPPAGVPEQEELTVMVRVDTQPVAKELQVITAVPGILPVTTPAEVMLAMVGLLLVHEPGMVLESIIVSDTQTAEAPLITGVGSMIIPVVRLHPATV